MDSRFDEILKKARKDKATGTRNKPRHIESEIQRSCKKWFDYQYSRIASLCFAVPNGGFRNGLEAKIMYAEGVTAGVSDMILLVPRHGYGCLCMEFKTPTGKQSAHQIKWQTVTEDNGNKYVIIRSLDDFMDIVNKYLKE